MKNEYCTWKNACVLQKSMAAPAMIDVVAARETGETEREVEEATR